MSITGLPDTLSIRPPPPPRPPTEKVPDGSDRKDIKEQQRKCKCRIYYDPVLGLVSDEYFSQSRAEHQMMQRSSLESH